MKNLLIFKDDTGMTYIVYPDYKDKKINESESVFLERTKLKAKKKIKKIKNCGSGEVIGENALLKKLLDAELVNENHLRLKKESKDMYA